MAGYAGVRDAVDSVVALLRAHVTTSGEAGLNGIPVRPDSPRELEVLNVASAVSVWLYRVEIDRDLANQLPSRPAPSLLRRRPLPLRLWLMVVPLNPDTSTRLLLLGRVAQVLDDHRMLSGVDLSGALAADGSTLTLTPHTPDTYDLNQIWSSQQTFARPSVCLGVSGLLLDDHHGDLATSVVLDAAALVDQIVGVAP